MSDALLNYFSELRKEKPVKCQRCECLEIDFIDGDWSAVCSEVKCYRDD